MCPEDESIIMSSFVNTMTSLSVKQGKLSLKKKKVWKLEEFVVHGILVFWDEESFLNGLRLLSDNCCYFCFSGGWRRV